MPDPKKLVFVCNTSWGIYKFRLTLIRQLIRAGYQVYVLAPQDRYAGQLLQEQGLIFIPLLHCRPTSFSPLSDWKLYRELRRHYRLIQPQLIFHYTIKANLYGTLAAAAQRCPSISVVTGLGYTFLNNKLMRSIARRMYRFSLQKAAEVWLLNTDDRNYFVSSGIAPLSKTYLLPGEGIDAEKFTAPDRCDIQPTIHFLLIGRIIKEKGIAEYAEAASLLKQKGYAVECRLVGYHDYRNPSSISHKKLADWISEGKIVYLGGTDEVRPFIEEADCIVLPSYREGMPVSLLEAASMRRPLIASDTAGCREIVKDGRNGFLCRVKDAQSLANAMEKLYHLSQAERIAMGQEARKTVCSAFTMEIVETHYFDAIARHIHHAPPSPRQAKQAKKISG